MSKKLTVRYNATTTTMHSSNGEQKKRKKYNKNNGLTLASIDHDDRKKRAVREILIKDIIPPIQKFEEYDVKAFSRIIVESNGFVSPLVLIKTKNLPKDSNLYMVYKNKLTEEDSDKYIIVDGGLRFNAYKVIVEDDSLGIDKKVHQNRILAIELSDVDTKYVDKIRENMNITRNMLDEFGLEDFDDDCELDEGDRELKLEERRTVKTQSTSFERRANSQLIMHAMHGFKEETKTPEDVEEEK